MCICFNLMHSCIVVPLYTKQYPTGNCVQNIEVYLHVMVSPMCTVQICGKFNASCESLASTDEFVTRAHKSLASTRKSLANREPLPRELLISARERFANHSQVSNYQARSLVFILCC